MKNKFLFQLKNKIKIKITGRNIDRFLKKVISSNIELLKVKYKNRNEADILIYEKDYEKVVELKSIYEITTLDYYGMHKIKNFMKKNQVLFFFLLIGFSFFLFLSNIIFEIEVIHTNKDIRHLILKELEEHGIYEKSFKKSFQQIEQIKKQIIEKYKDKIEWLEIENVGVKYIIRVEERKIVDIKEDTEKGNIVASKDAILKKVVARSGEIVRNLNDYVKKGDTIISGQIYLNEELKNTVRADGEVFGEVWYETSVEYPLTYYEVKETGRQKNVYSLRFLNKNFDLTLHPFKTKLIEETLLLKSPLLPIQLSKQKQRETEIIDAIYTEEEAVSKALELSRKRLEETLKEDEYIISQKNLKITINESTIKVEVFFTVYENITSFIKIEPSEE